MSYYKLTPQQAEVLGITDLQINPATEDTLLDILGSVETSNYDIKIDEASDSVTYIGYAAPGVASSASTWKIFKLTVSGTVTTKRFADGVTTYTKKWDDRTTYTYGA